MARSGGRVATRRVLKVGAGVLALALAAAAWSEWRGWPFLASPAEQWLSRTLGRTVQFGPGVAPVVEPSAAPGAAQSAAPSAGPSSAPRGGFALHLWPQPRLHLNELQVAGPDWQVTGPENKPTAEPADVASAAPTLSATHVRLAWRWADLLALLRTPDTGPPQPLHIDTLSADTLTTVLLRRADGRASWQFGPRTPGTGAPTFDGVRLRSLTLRQGQVRIDDRLTQLQLLADFSVDDGPTPPAPDAMYRLHGSANGSYAGLPLLAAVRTGAPQHWASPGAPAVPVALALSVGRAALGFEGTVSGPLASPVLLGRYRVSGPSLAAVGEPLGLTLPTTDAFAMHGRLHHAGTRWSTVVDAATVARSRLGGAFTFDTPPGQVPLLSGRLYGPALLLQDLGPAVGTTATPTTRAAATRQALPAAQALAPVPAQAGLGTRPSAAPGRVLPNRPFDLPRLRAMNANVLVALDRLDPGTPALQPVQPLRAHLQLRDGVLALNAIDARLAQGRVQGRLELDGRSAPAQWQAHLSGNGLRLEQWLRPLQRAAGQAPWATGRLGGRLDLSGQGHSTADMLATASGRVLLHWTQGTVSHLAVEAAGLDLAQGLGVALRGDDALVVNCGAGDLAVQRGEVKPRVLLIDTADSVVAIQGSLSLATERLALVARVSPKDFSPLALRSPLHIDGSFAAPRVSIEKLPLLKRLLPAVALGALVGPLAALLPLMDTGDRDTADAVAACRAVAGSPPRATRRVVGKG